MDWDRVIERNHEALKRVLAAMAGLGGLAGAGFPFPALGSEGWAGQAARPGGGGNDALDGGGGIDTFTFASSDGSDTVSDFEDGTDLLRFLGTSATDMSGLTIVDVGSDVQIIVDSTTVTLVGVTSASLDSSDFLFV